MLEVAYLRSDTPKIHELNAFKYELTLIEKAFEEFQIEFDLDTNLNISPKQFKVI